MAPCIDEDGDEGDRESISNVSEFRQKLLETLAMNSRTISSISTFGSKKKLGDRTLTLTAYFL